MLHALLITAHAACGVAAFAAGCLMLRPPRQHVPATLSFYIGMLWLMILFLLLVVALDWSMLDTGVRLVYGALSLLALYVGWRGWHSSQDLQQRRMDWRGAYMDDIGFTLIALFDGFVIIAALDLGAPGWLALVVGVLGVLAGRTAISRAKMVMEQGQRAATRMM